MGLFSQAEFFTTVNHLQDLPMHGGKEIGTGLVQAIKKQLGLK